MARARSVGLTGAQHQLLLAVKGHGGLRRSVTSPSTSSCATTAPSSSSTRAVAAGLLERLEDADDHRCVRMQLTREGESTIAALSASHLEELSRLRSSFEALWQDLPDPVA